MLDRAPKLEPGEQEAEPEHHDRDEETREDVEEARDRAGNTAALVQNISWLLFLVLLLGLKGVHMYDGGVCMCSVSRDDKLSKL